MKSRKHQIEVTTWELAHIVLGLTTAIKTKMRNARRSKDEHRPACCAMECADLQQLVEKLTQKFREAKAAEEAEAAAVVSSAKEEGDHGTQG